MLRRLWICAGLAGCAVDAEPPLPPLTGEARALTAHDVSVLVASPAEGWPAAMPALGGALVPRERFAEVARSLTPSLDYASEYAALRVVALRVDPCFRTNWGASACQAQLRLVLQVIGDDGVPLDGALHALYNLDDGAFAALLADVEALTAAAPEQADAALPLGVSPALLAQGPGGPYAQHLRATVARHVGAANLARLTFATRTAARSGQWEFGGRAILPRAETGFGAPGPLVIRPLGSDVTLQTVTQMVAPAYAYVATPTVAAVDGEPALEAARLAALPPAERVESHAWAVRQEDPRRVTADSTDCASCHLAGRARAHLEASYPELVDAATVAARPAHLATVDDPASLRMFGYFGAQPVVTLRVAAETRDVLAALADWPR